jgi:hypothetical protein
MRSPDAASARLTSPIETRAHQNDANRERAATHEGWNDVRGVFRGLDLQFTDPRYVPGFMRRENGNRQPNKSKQSKESADDHQAAHGTRQLNLRT